MPFAVGALLDFIDQTRLRARQVARILRQHATSVRPKFVRLGQLRDQPLKAARGRKGNGAGAPIDGARAQLLVQKCRKNKMAQRSFSARALRGVSKRRRL
jgi:hypothetical protein